MAGAKEKLGRRGKSARRSPGNLLPGNQELPKLVQIAQRLGRQIPARELRAIPKDLSDQIDHYVYGTPKR
jgi:hypothetical protein